MDIKLKYYLFSPSTAFIRKKGCYYTYTHIPIILLHIHAQTVTYLNAYLFWRDISMT